MTPGNVERGVGATLRADKGRDVADEPRCLDILLNYACNAKCLFCSQDFSWRKAANELPFEKAVEQMYRAYKDGYRRLGFTGGEPTLRRDLPKLIALARKIGYTYIRIQTNGLRLADRGCLESLAQAGLTFVKLSIHGHNAAAHDKLAGVPGAFEKCLRAIDNLRDLRIGVGVNIVLNKLNYRHLDRFYDLFLVRLGISNFVIIAPLHEGNMSLHTGKLGVRLTEATPYVRKVFARFNRLKFPKPPLLLHFTPCVLPGYERQMLGWSNFNTLVVHPDGERKDLDRTAQVHTVKTETCRRCVYDGRCIGLDRSYADRFGTGELVPLLKIPKSRDVPSGRGSPKGRTLLTDNEQCVLEVLNIRSPATTREFLRIAAGIPLCRDCKDENAVVTAAETLVLMGRVRRRFERGKYMWSLSI